jgi:hypothetical protein
VILAAVSQDLMELIGQATSPGTMAMTAPSPLVGFRSCDPYAESAFDFFEVVDVQGDEFGAT